MSSVYSLEVTEDGGKKTLKFGGDLVINHIDKIATELKGLLNPVPDLNVEIDNPNNIDTTFLQMVIAMKHSCKAVGKNFLIKTTLKDDLKELTGKAGFNKELNI